MSISLVILAAGLSSRFAPGMKQLARVGPAGETLMDYCIYDALLAGFENVVVVVRSEIETAVSAHLARWAGKVAVRVVVQHAPGNGRARPLGTVHAVLAARNAVQDAFAVMNADDYYGPDAFYRMAVVLTGQSPNGSPDAATGWLAGYTLADTLSESGGVTRAVCAVSGDGYMQGIVEAYDVRQENGRVTGVVADRRQQLPARATVSTNLWGFTPGVFDLMQSAIDGFLASNPDDQGELRIADVVGGWLESGGMAIRVFPAAGPWFGLTHEGDLRAVRNAIATLVHTHAYPPDLFDSAAAETSGRPG